VGEEGNDIIFSEIDEDDYLLISSYDRTANRFIILVARKDEDEDPEDIELTLPATIQRGARYNRDNLFVGEGFSEGEKVQVQWISEDIEPKTGYRKNLTIGKLETVEVKDDHLTFTIPSARRLTTLVFMPSKP